MDMLNTKHSELTAIILKAFYKVYNTLGYGFLEKVYERAMMIELRKMGLNCTSQSPVRVYYDGEEVGFYNSDIFVEQVIIAELKAATALCEADEAQLTNYLKATKIEVGILLNFGRKPEFKRKVFSNEYKKHIPPMIDDHNQS